MAELGIGTRVFVGWCPDDLCDRGYEPERCQRGTIYRGPEINLLRGIGDHPQWWVRLDSGKDSLVAEYLLTPIDDDGETQDIETEETEEREAEEL